jgi:hypothetical protein
MSNDDDALERLARIDPADSPEYDQLGDTRSAQRRLAAILKACKRVLSSPPTESHETGPAD